MTSAEEADRNNYLVAVACEDLVIDISAMLREAGVVGVDESRGLARAIVLLVCVRIKETGQECGS